MSADVIANFIASMEAAGVKPLEPISQQLMGGKIVRFRADGDKPGKRNAWAILYFDKRPAGAFGSYRMGLKQRWKANDLNERSEEHTSELQSLMRISYAVFCLKKKTTNNTQHT